MPRRSDVEAEQGHVLLAGVHVPVLSGPLDGRPREGDFHGSQLREPEDSHLSRVDVIPGCDRRRVGDVRLYGPGEGASSAKKTSMATLASVLQSQVGRPVVDKTSLSGSYDFDLE